MSQNAGSEEAERHGTRFSALFLGILSTQSRIGPGCLATVSKKLQIKGAVGYRVIEPSEGIVALSRRASTPSAAGGAWIWTIDRGEVIHNAFRLRRWADCFERMHVRQQDNAHAALAGRGTRTTPAGLGGSTPPRRLATTGGLVSDYSQRTAPHLAEKLRGKKPSVVDSVPIY